jgi:hypothetical protein
MHHSTITLCRTNGVRCSPWAKPGERAQLHRRPNVCPARPVSLLDRLLVPLAPCTMVEACFDVYLDRSYPLFRLLLMGLH